LLHRWMTRRAVRTHLQIRGRVGRGARQSYCYLVTPHEEATSKLSILAQSANGFAVAQRDLEMRGQGDVCGKKQSGHPVKVTHPCDDSQGGLPWLREKHACAKATGRYGLTEMAGFDGTALHQKHLFRFVAA
jgi:hypothetical protein